MFNFIKKLFEIDKKEINKEELLKSRRNFIKKASIATAALTLGPSVNAIANTLGIEKEELNFTPVKKPDSISDEVYNDINILISRMEKHFQNNGKTETLKNKIGKINILVPRTNNNDEYNNDIYKYVYETIIANPQYFKMSKALLDIDTNYSKLHNQSNMHQKLRDFIETPYQITDMEADANLILEYELSKTTTAPDANRSIEETATSVAKLYDGLCKSYAYNLPDGEKKIEILKLEESKNLEWGSFPNGLNKDLVPELICKATLEFDNEKERLYKTALNLKLAYDRTESFNKLVSNNLTQMGNSELSEIFKQRALEYKRKSVSLSHKISKNTEKPGSVKYDFSEDELKRFLTPGDKNKLNSRKVILSVPISQRTSAAKTIQTNILTPLYCLTVTPSGMKYNFYNEEYKRKTIKYMKEVREPIKEIFEWEQEDKKFVELETVRIKNNGGEIYYVNNYKSSDMEAIRR